MRLLTHNLLAGPKGGYPLKIKVEKVEELEVEYDADYVKRLLAKVDWNGVLSALGDLQEQGFFKDVAIPKEAPPLDYKDENVLKQIHHVLNEIKIVTGQLECPETHTKFAVDDGIPKMVFEEGSGADA